MNILNNIEKKPYQRYTIKHGIEEIQIQIPLRNVQVFEADFAAAVKSGVDDKDSFIRLMNSYGGNIRLKHRDQ